MSAEPRPATPPVAYWAFAIAVEVLAFPAVFSIGVPMLALGGVLVLLGLLYRWRSVFWSLVAITTLAWGVWIYGWLTSG